MKHILIAVLMMFAVQLAGAEEPTQQEPASQAMNNQRLQTILDRIAGEVGGRPGFWEFTVHGYKVSVITDEWANRMRISVPIV